jgi:hypothetical protein
LPSAVGTVLLALTLGSAVDTDADACRKAADRYEIVVAEVVDALRAYEKCVSASRARDACTAEYEDLDLAQDRFETAVSDYGSGCRR